MTLSCFCGFKEIFNKKDDSRDFRNAGWKIIGFNIRQNEPYYECQKCQVKRQKQPKIPKFNKEQNPEQNLDDEQESLYLKT